MEVKENGDLEDYWQVSPFEVLQQLSEEAVRVAGEALSSVSLASPSLPPRGSGHRRSLSEVGTSESGSNNNVQRWKSQMQRVLQWDSNSQEQRGCSYFNLEILANQKRQWYQLHSKISDHKKFEEPTSLFEHFIIAGLRPDTDLDPVEGALVRRKKWELQMQNSEFIDFKILAHRGPSIPTLEPQILFKYPPGKRLAMRRKDLAAFCFPGGVKAGMLERTPSLSELHELVYGQEHLSSDDLSFVFSLKVADNATLYGVCLYVQEFVQRPPAVLGSPPSPLSQSSGGCSRFLVSAPRCYCVLTRVPFFELHYEMLQSIVAQDRLNRITQFVDEMTLADYSPATSNSSNQMRKNIDFPYRESSNDLVASAVPVDNAAPLIAPVAGIRSDDGIPSTSSKWESESLKNCTASEASDCSQAREIDKNSMENSQFLYDCTSEVSDVKSNGSERMHGNHDNGKIRQVRSCVCPRSRTLQRIRSCESLFSSVRSLALEDEDDEFFFSQIKNDAGNDMILKWPRENKNDLLQIICAYQAMPVPQRGSKTVFQPLEHLQAFEFWRPSVSSLGVSQRQQDLAVQDSLETAEINLTLAAAEEAAALSVWATATICRVLSLESVLALVSGVLLEKQVIVICRNLGVLSAAVLSLIPMIRPFEWQSLFLPVLPGKMLGFLDAPVPFIVGVQHKPADLKMKTSLVRVNVAKDQVKMYHLPALPRQKELLSALGPIHARLSCEHTIARRHPIYKFNEVEAEATAQFLTVMRNYLESLCSDLRSHTITSVQSNNDRVSLLLKDSFIGSFPIQDQPFIKLFVDTQLFTVLSDSRLSSYENGYS